MKKNGRTYIGMVVVIGLCMVIFMPITGKALVWVTPMKMQAEGTISAAGFCEVEKAIILKNDGNDSVFVSLNATGIEVVFEDTIIELKGGEQKIIRPVVIVEEGKQIGSISVVGYDKDISREGIGAQIISSMGITVTTIGNKISSSAGFYFPGIGFIVLLIGIGGAVVVTLIYTIVKKKKSAQG
jgi:hypothetical protein